MQSYPLQKKYHSPDFLRTIPHLRARLPANALLLQLRSQVISSITEYFNERAFVQTHPPIITSSDCEGAGEVFTISNASDKAAASNSAEAQDSLFFRTPKYLTVSSQLHLESLVPSVGKVWTLSPTFRAEKSDTPRHLSEFYMLEVEMGFASEDGLESVTSLLEGMVRHVVTRLQSSQIGLDLLSARDFKSATDNPDGLLTSTELEKRWEHTMRSRGGWLHLTYEEAIKGLQESAAAGHRFEFKPELGAPLQAEHEKYMAETFSYGSPIFVTDYPADIKAFYMSPGRPIQQEGTLETAACFDLLVPDLCELAGGSVREHRLPQLLQSMKRHGILTEAEESQVPANLKWYTDLRRYGSIPHGGFGLGFDRLISYLAGIPTVRDVVTFPRWHGRCDC